MTDDLDWPPILDAIEVGLNKARQQKLDAGEPLEDDFSAFVVLRELHREGWSVVRPPASSS